MEELEKELCTSVAVEGKTANKDQRVRLRGFSFFGGKASIGPPVAVRLKHALSPAFSTVASPAGTRCDLMDGRNVLSFPMRGMVFVCEQSSVDMLLGISKRRSCYFQMPLRFKSVILMLAHPKVPFRVYNLLLSVYDSIIWTLSITFQLLSEVAQRGIRPVKVLDLCLL